MHFWQEFGTHGHSKANCCFGHDTVAALAEESGIINIWWRGVMVLQSSSLFDIIDIFININTFLSAFHLDQINSLSFHFSVILCITWTYHCYSKRDNICLLWSLYSSHRFTFLSDCGGSSVFIPPGTGSCYFEESGEGSGPEFPDGNWLPERH